MERSDGSEEQVSVSVPDAVDAARLAGLEKAVHHVQEAPE